MTNILVFQPYLSNRKLSSGTLERQFRFLRKSNAKVYALFEDSEKDYANSLDWINPIIVKDLTINTFLQLSKLQKQYNFKELYIARTYFTPCTKEQKQQLKDLSFDENDFRYWRNYVPIFLSEFDTNLKVNHMIYDPLELKYDGIIPDNQYEMFSSMNNVENAKCHYFAEIGYYDKNKEVLPEHKDYLFTFGATSVEPNRTKLLKSIKDGLSNVDKVNLFFRYDDFDNLVDNAQYEKLTSKSCFTYTIPSYCPEHMSFTRMLLALSQGTIPLLHPENNLSCLFSKDFAFRKDLEPFFKELIFDVEDLKDFFSMDIEDIRDNYLLYLEKWHNLDFYKWLQSNAY